MLWTRGSLVLGMLLIRPTFLQLFECSVFLFCLLTVTSHDLVWCCSCTIIAPQPYRLFSPFSSFLSFSPLHFSIANISELIAQVNSSKVKAMNPKLVFETNLLKASAPPKVEITFINDSKHEIDATGVAVSTIFDVIQRKTDSLRRQGIKSDMEVQALKDIDN